MGEASLLTKNDLNYKINEFRQTLINRRQDLKLTQGALAKKCKINLQRYKRFEGGYGADAGTAYKLSLEEIVRLLDELGILEGIHISANHDALTQVFLQTVTGKQWARKAAIEYCKENGEKDIEKHKKAISEIEAMLQQLNGTGNLF